MYSFWNSYLSIPTFIDSWLHLSKRKVNLAAPWQEAKASKDDANIANRFQTSQGESGNGRKKNVHTKFQFEFCYSISKVVIGKYTRLSFRRQGFNSTRFEIPVDKYFLIEKTKLKRLRNLTWNPTWIKSIPKYFNFQIYFPFLFLQNIFISSSYQPRAIKSTIYWRAKNWSLACFYYREHYTTYFPYLSVLQRVFLNLVYFKL